MALDFPTSPTNGQVFGNFYYDSSITAWRNLGSKNALNTRIDSVIANNIGMTPIIPTSVTVGSGSATVNSKGQVTFTGASSILFQNALADYRFYKIFYEITSASSTDTTMGFRVASGTTAYTGTEYFFGGTRVGHQSDNNLVYGASQSVSTVGPISTAGAGSYGIGGHIDIEGANYATQTKTQVQATMATSAVVYGVTIGGSLLNANAYNGFQLLPFTGTFGGIVSIYGFNQ